MGGSNEIGLSEMEQRRANNIQRNENRLKELGLLDPWCSTDDVDGKHREQSRAGKAVVKRKQPKQPSIPRKSFPRGAKANVVSRAAKENNSTNAVKANVGSKVEDVLVGSRMGPCVNLLAEFVRTSISKDTDSADRPDIGMYQAVVKLSTPAFTHQIVDPIYKSRLGTSLRVMIDNVQLCPSVTSGSFKYGLECIHCCRNTKNACRLYPTNHEDVIVGLEVLHNHLAVCEYRSDDDRQYTQWLKNPKMYSDEVNLISNMVMKRLQGDM